MSAGVGSAVRVSLRVLMVCPQFAPIIGGYERAAERLSGALAALGHEVTVVAERRNPTWPREERRDGFRVVRVRCVYRRYAHTLSSQAGLAAFLARHLRRLDVVHLHQYGAGSVVPLVLARLWRRPTVLKLTSTGPMGIGNVPRGMLGGLSAFMEARVSACVAPTTVAAQEARQFGVPAERVHVIPNGIDTTTWVPLDVEGRGVLRKRMGIEEDTLLALAVGRLSPEKNVTAILRAWHQFVAVQPTRKARLVIIGDGPDRTVLQAQSRHPGLPESVSLVGEISDVRSWYQSADLAIFASQGEGLSNSVIEAMSCGVPIVATAASVPADLDGSPGLGEVVERPEPAALARAIELLASDEERRVASGRLAREHVLARYDINVVARRVEELYLELAGRRWTSSP